MSNLEVFKKIRDEWDRFFDMPDNSDYHFNRIKELMKQKKDFDVSLYRDRYIRGRIYHRVRNLNLPSMKEYYQYLNDNPKEMNHLKSLLTVHTTEFFRDIHPFQYLESSLLPKIAQKLSPSNKLRIVSAPCSTGQETYSLAIIVHKLIKSRVIKCPVEILGVDIDKQSIEKAREGIYRKDEMKNVSSQILNDCFKQVGTDYQVKDEIKQYCRFEIHDLFKPLVYDHKSDLILCRNFLIYISTEDQSKVIQNVNTNLKKNGYVMLGITEGFKLMNELEYEIEDIDGRIYKFKGSKDTGNVVDYYDNVNDNNLETHGSQSYSYNYISPKPAAKATTERNKKLNAATTRLEKASDRLMDRLNASTKEKSANAETTNIVGTSTVSEQVKPKEGSFDSKSPSNMVIQESKTVVLNSDRAEDEQDDDTQSGAPQVLTLEEAKKNYNIQESSSSNEAIKVRVSNTLDSHNSGSSIKQTVDTSKINKLRKRLPVRVGRFNDMSEEAKIKQKVKEIKNEKYAEIDRIVEKMKKTEPDSEVNEKSGEVKTRSHQKRKEKESRTQKTEEKNVRLEEPSLPLTAEEVYRRELGIDYILKKQDEEREDIQKIIEKAMAKKTKTKTKTKKKKEK